jgi:FlaA1/EpsC-like NDP-sugar epimerase
MIRPESNTTRQPAVAPLRAAIPTRVHRYRSLWMRLIQAALFSAAGAAAWGLGLALSAGRFESTGFLALFGTLIAAKLVCFELFRLHRASWRWFGLPDSTAITIANTSGSVLGALALGPRIASIPIAALLLIEWLASQALLLGSRMLFRVLADALQNTAGPPRRKRVLIYGAGRRGLNLLRRIRGNPVTPFEIAGFIDDDPAKRYLTMQMTPVLGSGDELPRLARLHQVDEILIAMRWPARANRDRFRKLARFAGVCCRFPKNPAAAPRSHSPRHARVTGKLRVEK